MTDDEIERIAIENQVYTETAGDLQFFGAGLEVGRNSGWPEPIPVSERLPEGLRAVLVYTDGAGWLVKDTGSRGFDKDGNWLSRDGDVITHWLQMPPKPS